MHTTMKILICTDGSVALTEAIKCVLGALRKDNKFTVLYVLSEHGVYYSYKSIFKEDLEKIDQLFGEKDSEKEAAKKIFLSPIYEYMKNAGYNVRDKVREGHVIEEILDEIREGGYNVIMLGDKTGLSPARLLLGSTVSEVMHRAKACVIVIKPPESAYGQST
jgi:nucleotide-binding universal stress UspA family protein